MLETPALPAPPSSTEDLAALVEVARIASADLELRPMLQRIADTLAQRFGWELVCLVQVDLPSGEFVCEALTTSLPTAVHVGYRRELGSGVVGTVATTGLPLLIDDARSYPEFIHTFAGAQSEICVPIVHRGELVGILNAESRRLAEFHGQLPLVQAIADQIAGAIGNARLYDEISRRAAAFEALTEVSRLATRPGDMEGGLADIADYLQRRFDLTLAAVVVSDEKGREWEHRAFASRTPAASPRVFWPTSAGVVGRAIRTGQAQLVLDVKQDPDYFGIHPEVVAELVVPLRFREQILGALLYASDSPALFHPDTVRLFEALADHVAGAIELAVVNQRLAESERQLAATAERLAAVNGQLLRLTLTDGLTGAANRRCFEDRLADEWRRAQRMGLPVSLALIDIDHFKAYNDHFGHPAGDACLRQVAQILSRGLGRAGELVARWGGEEFAAILPGSAAEVAERNVERVRRRVEAAKIPHPTSPTGPYVTVSAGVVTEIPERRRPPERLLERADQALYRAKGNGRNRTEAE
jgi:diguanylate cyclase (GGDEF)-like protein